MNSEEQMIWDIIDRLLAQGLSTEMTDLLLLVQEFLEQGGDCQGVKAILISFLHA